MVLLVLALQIALIGTLGSLPIAAEQHSQSLWTIIPPIIAATGTVLAFGVTFTLFLQGWKDRVREQASRVYVITDLDEEGHVVATVHNRSPLPIWEVEAHPMRADEVVPTQLLPRRPDLPPDGEAGFCSGKKPSEIDRDWQLDFLDAAERGWMRKGSRLIQKGKSRLFR